MVLLSISNVNNALLMGNNGVLHRMYIMDNVVILTAQKMNASPNQKTFVLAQSPSGMQKFKI